MNRILHVITVICISALFEPQRIVSQDTQSTPIEESAQSASALDAQKPGVGDPLWDMIYNSTKYSPDIQQTIYALLMICRGHDFGYLKNLKELDFCGYAVKDLTPLTYLTNLEVLSLDVQSIEEITPLASLTKLKKLVLSNNKIKDISVLSKLPNLEYLLIYNNQISDITPLSNLTNLENLCIFGNHIKDLAPLTRLTKLKELQAARNLIDDVSPLSKLIHLERLDLGSNRIKDATPLASCTRLEELSLSENKISDLRSLTSLGDLTSLSLSNNQIIDVTPLAKLMNLEFLYLSHNQIINAAPLTKLKKLRFLHLDHNHITKAKSFDQMKRIEFIDLEGNPLKDRKESSIQKSPQINDPEKFARDLAESREVTSLKGKTVFDQGIGGRDNKDLRKPLPDGVTHDELIKLLAGDRNGDNEVVTFDHAIACVWPGRPKLFIGIGANKDGEGIHISVVAFSIKKPHDFEVVAHTHMPCKIDYIEKKGSGRLAPNGTFNELVRFDESIYKIAPDEYACGLRLAHNQGYAGGFAHFENLILFALKDKTLVPILNHPIYSLENYAGQWHDDGSREHFVTEIEWDFKFSRTKRNNHFDIQLKTKQKINNKHKKSHLVWNDGQYVLKES